jgi:hypothetical protein
MLSPTTKSVNLAELSMNGNLASAIPSRLLVKYSPPSLTIVYHFENDPSEKYFHEVPISAEDLASRTADEIASDLYVTDAYYFNPKMIKRPQLLGLIGRLKDN